MYHARAQRGRRPRARRGRATRTPARPCAPLRARNADDRVGGDTPRALGRAARTDKHVGGPPAEVEHVAHGLAEGQRTRALDIDAQRARAKEGRLSHEGHGARVVQRRRLEAERAAVRGGEEGEQLDGDPRERSAERGDARHHVRRDQRGVRHLERHHDQPPAPEPACATTPQAAAAAAKRKSERRGRRRWWWQAHTPEPALEHDPRGFGVGLRECVRSARRATRRGRGRARPLGC